MTDVLVTPGSGSISWVDSGGTPHALKIVGNTPHELYVLSDDYLTAGGFPVNGAMFVFQDSVSGGTFLPGYNSTASNPFALGSTSLRWANYGTSADFNGAVSLTSTGGASGAPLIFSAASAPTTQAAGQLWWDGTNFYFASSASVKTNILAGGVTGVSNSDGTLTISPNAGAVVASLALGHANTWTALQSYTGGVTVNSGGLTVGTGIVALAGNFTTTGGVIALASSAPSSVTVPASGILLTTTPAATQSITGAKTAFAAAATGYASLNLPSSAAVNPTSPVSGDIWWNGTNLYFYNGSASKDILIGAVTSVAGRTGVVTLTNTDVSGLGTAAVANLPSPGSNASSVQVVRGDDTRLAGAGTALQKRRVAITFYPASATADTVANTTQVARLPKGTNGAVSQWKLMTAILRVETPNAAATTAQLFYTSNPGSAAFGSGTAALSSTLSASGTSSYELSTTSFTGSLATTGLASGSLLAPQFSALGGSSVSLECEFEEV